VGREFIRGFGKQETCMVDHPAVYVGFERRPSREVESRIRYHGFWKPESAPDVGKLGCRVPMTGQKRNPVRAFRIDGQPRQSRFGSLR
jgi:hypothetical protein